MYTVFSKDLYIVGFSYLLILVITKISNNFHNGFFLKPYKII